MDTLNVEELAKDAPINPIIWKYMQLYKPKGKVLCVGEQDNNIKDFFKKYFPEAKPVTLDVEGEPDIKLDLCLNSVGENQFDYILCQAVLEHVVAPTVAIRNLFIGCKPGAIGIFHTHTPGFGVHRHPFDCWRMMYDTPNVIAGYLGLQILHRAFFFHGCGPHVVFVLRKPLEPLETINFANFTKLDNENWQTDPGITSQIIKKEIKEKVIASN